MTNAERAKSCAAVSDEGGDEQVRNKAREAGDGRNREKPLSVLAAALLAWLTLPTVAYTVSTHEEHGHLVGGSSRHSQ